MPCFNEEKYISQAIESLLDDWVIENCELIVVDGGSVDKTKEIVEALSQKIGETSTASKRTTPFLRILNNSARIQASGMNKGIEEAKGEIIVRADAHCLYPEGYVRRCVELLEKLEKEGVANVGGFIKPVGNGLIQQAIALALKNPVGVGDSRWHLGRKSGYVDTVYLGTFRKKELEAIGLYDPKAHPNEDAELNLRLLKAGKKIYLDGSLGVFYFVRESLRSLAKQYFHYGQGRAYTTWKHRRLTSWRQLAPVAVMIGVGTSLIAGFFWPPLWLIPAGYLLVLIGGATSSFYFEAKRSERVIPKLKTKGRLFILIIASFAVIHFCWAAGFISKIFKLFWANFQRKSLPFPTAHV
ncbi:MAG: glycosyltransferase family 2 protein [Candidatus Aminicenantes bacterium]|nr:glycosyltransferase family 2 protein [Candidatus Aminicenantes bacterium]